MDNSHMFRPFGPTGIPPSGLGSGKNVRVIDVHDNPSYDFTFSTGREPIRVKVKDGIITGAARYGTILGKDWPPFKHLIGQSFETMKRLHEQAGGTVVEAEYPAIHPELQ